MASLVDLTTQIRILIGSPSITELPDATLQSLLTVEALEWLNKRRPNKSLGSLTTVNGQQDYDDKPATAYRVTDVFWMGGGFEMFSPTMRWLPASLGVDDRTSGFNIVENPALVSIFYKHIEAYKQNFEGNGRETEGGLIRLEPQPDGSGTEVYFFYTHPRWALVTAVPAEYIEGLKKRAAVLCLDVLFLKRGVVRSGRQFVGGGGANEDVVRKRYMEEAESAVPMMANPFHHG